MTLRSITEINVNTWLTKFSVADKHQPGTRHARWEKDDCRRAGGQRERVRLREGASRRRRRNGTWRAPKTTCRGEGTHFGTCCKMSASAIQLLDGTWMNSTFRRPVVTKQPLPAAAAAAVGAGAPATKHAPFLCYSPTRAKRGQVDLFPR